MILHKHILCNFVVNILLLRIPSTRVSFPDDLRCKDVSCRIYHDLYVLRMRHISKDLSFPQSLSVSSSKDLIWVGSTTGLNNKKKVYLQTAKHRWYDRKWAGNERQGLICKWKYMYVYVDMGSHLLKQTNALMKVFITVTVNVSAEAWLRAVSAATVDTISRQMVRYWWSRVFTRVCVRAALFSSSFLVIHFVQSVIAECL